MGAYASVMVTVVEGSDDIGVVSYSRKPYARKRLVTRPAGLDGMLPSSGSERVVT